MLNCFKGNTPKYVVKSNTLVLNQKCIRNNVIDFSLAQYTEDKCTNENKILRLGDLIINSTGQGTAGRCAYVSELPNTKVTVDSHMLIVRFNNKDLSKFFSYFLYKNEELMLTLLTGSSGQGEFDKERAFNIKFPYCNENKEIFCKIFDAIADKIQLNNKINAELENMAKTLYDYWFVQFDFPDENKRPYKSANGKMVYNEVLKREIPEGWEVIKFDDLVEQAPKLKAIKAPDYKNQGNIPIVDQASTLITGRTDDMSYYYKNERNCVVFGDVTTCFKYINFPFAKGTDGTKIINAKDDRIPAILLYQLLKDTKLPNIGFARHYMFLREIKLLLPPQDICEKYYQATKGIMDLRAKNLKENYKLSITRDFLLPLLMNGQVSVQD